MVSWSDRRKYRDASGYCYIDFANSRLVFTKQPSSAQAVEFDYHGAQTALASGESPWFPEEYHDAIYHLMCVDSFVIQQSPKAKSYKSENEEMAETIINNMKYWNSQLIQM